MTRNERLSAARARKAELEAYFDATPDEQEEHYRLTVEIKTLLRAGN